MALHMFRSTDLNKYFKLSKNMMGKTFCHRLTQTYTDISVPRLAGLKESSHSRVKYPFIWGFPEGSTFCFAIACPVKYIVNISLGSAKQKVCVCLESVANRWLIIDLVSLGVRHVSPILGLNRMQPSLRMNPLST